MNSRQAILDAVRKSSPPAVELPELSGNWTTYAEPKAQFRQVLEAVGGRAIEVEGPAAMETALNQLDCYRDADRIWSLVEGIESAGGNWTGAVDPHALESLQCCLVSGEFAVAENGAVWVTDRAISQRAALFITQHLILAVPAHQLVQNMHEAYARLSFDGARFGIFISGPSKTADIEQSLVIGAHGARSLTVLLVEGMVS